MINREFVKAGILHLINNDKDKFVEALSIYLQNKEAIIDYLFKGPLPINEEVEKLCSAYIKTTLASPESFIKILNIETDFDYSDCQQYRVSYLVTKYYNIDNQPYQGISLKDTTHQIGKATETMILINPNKIFH